MNAQILADGIKFHRNIHNDALTNIWFYEEKGMGYVIVAVNKNTMKELRELIEKELAESIEETKKRVE